jgi:hypothetical protein
MEDIAQKQKAIRLVFFHQTLDALHAALGAVQIANHEVEHVSILPPKPIFSMR